ncbi:PadR family transcriptional regulator [Nocardioides acrostichi]|uniref:PadR family transcriptional regulator n=1 Tax=Nocardioides acrostichi TaxID=2784339 RepID=A0A930UZT2_9ACTN|nr:PadR family transcriptional regulator [Nocardioides acrostichi]MBF4163923.1 PadR family transcriptional regulator [Nocardioides acrostichi]
MARRGETIELAVLGLLHEGPMHGYELRKRLNLMLGWGRVLSYGSLYPALKKMLRANLIEEATVSPAPVSKRQRIVYEVTPTGHDEFERLMSEVGPAAWEDDTFDIRFAFFSSTDMEIRLRVLEGRRTRLQERLERVQQQLSMTQAEVDRYAAELQRHGVESVEREVRWLSELIDAERGVHVRDAEQPGPGPQFQQTTFQQTTTPHTGEDVRPPTGR